MKEVTFTKEKIGAEISVSELLMHETETTMYHDYLAHRFRVQLTAFIQSRLNEKQTITVYRERPTFWEWLTRKPRQFTFEFTAKEVLKNPPSLSPDQSVLMYEINEQISPH